MTAKRSTGFIPDRGDIVWIDHNPQVGKEMRDEHPMIVSSTAAFNARTGVLIGFPMTHAEFNADNPFAVPVQGPRKEVAYVLAFQPKSFDWRARRARAHAWGGGRIDVLRAVHAALDTICNICPRG